MYNPRYDHVKTFLWKCDEERGGEDVELGLKHDAIPPVTNTPCRKGPYLYVKKKTKTKTKKNILDYSLKALSSNASLSYFFFF